MKATSTALEYVPSPLDPYNVLVPTCHDDAELSKQADTMVSEYTPHLNYMRQKYNLDIEYNPCISHYTSDYLNRQDVLKAIHADSHYTRKWPEHPPLWSYNEGPAGAKKKYRPLVP